MTNATLKAQFEKGQITHEKFANDFDYNDIFAGLGGIPHTKESLKAEEVAKEIEAEEAIEAARYKKCGRCNGKGKIGHYHYVSGGVCFACDGAGKIYK